MNAFRLTTLPGLLTFIVMLIYLSYNKGTLILNEEGRTRVYAMRTSSCHLKKNAPLSSSSSVNAFC